MATSPHEVTQRLLAWGDGDRSALAKLTPLIYAEMSLIARAYLRREDLGQTLQTTAHVHEAYFRLIVAQRVRWENRAHFSGLCARLMGRRSSSRILTPICSQWTKRSSNWPGSARGRAG